MCLRDSSVATVGKYSSPMVRAEYRSSQPLELRCPVDAAGAGLATARGVRDLHVVDQAGSVPELGGGVLALDDRVVQVVEDPERVRVHAPGDRDRVRGAVGEGAGVVDPGVDRLEDELDAEPWVRSTAWLKTLTRRSRVRTRPGGEAAPEPRTIRRAAEARRWFSMPSSRPSKNASRVSHGSAELVRGSEVPT